jgi:putative hydrolase of the HAD superfamily
MDPALAHIRNWIFDLDNTLYPSSADLFALIDARMGEYIGGLLGVDRIAARKVQKGYFHAHGTTLAGLMADHQVDPHEFLRFVHDVPMDRLVPDHRVIDGIARLPGRRIVFTNGDASYAARVLDKLGLGDLFETIYDIHLLDYRPKPYAEGYERMCAALGIAAPESLFVEDMARNLVPAKALGMTTVWVNNGSEQAGADAQADLIDYITADLGDWLDHVLEKGE